MPSNADAAEYDARLRHGLTERNRTAKEPAAMMRHKNAAGARLNDTDLPRVRQRVLAAAERYLTMPPEETP